MWWFAFYLMGGAGGGSASSPCSIEAVIGGHNISATITSDEHTLVVPSTLSGYTTKC